MKRLLTLICLLLTFTTLICSCDEKTIVDAPTSEETTVKIETSPESVESETVGSSTSSVKQDPYLDPSKELTAKATHIPKMDMPVFQSVAGEDYYYQWTQGGCIAGEYLYTCMIANNNLVFPEKGCIVKINLDTYVMEARSQELTCGHMNDAAYNPEKNILVLANGTDSNTLHIVDADTLQFQKTVVVNMESVHLWCITYNTVKKQYVCLGGDGYLYYLNANFKFLRKETFEKTEGYAVQGMINDGTYLYLIEYRQNPNDHSDIKNNLVIYNLNTGKFIKKLDLGITRETEHFGFRNGKFYIACNNIRWNGMEFYEVEIIAK